MAQDIYITLEIVVQDVSGFNAKTGWHSDFSIWKQIKNACKHMSGSEQFRSYKILKLLS